MGLQFEYWECHVGIANQTERAAQAPYAQLRTHSRSLLREALHSFGGLLLHVH